MSVAGSLSVSQLKGDCQKLQEKDFWQKMADASVWGSNILSKSWRFRDKCTFAFKQKFKITAKKCRKTIFGKKWQITACSMEIKLFIEIPLCGMISQMNRILHIMQIFKMVAKYGGKTIYGKSGI